ncbi:MAG TPA: TetR family transcriptional regulator [Dermatophilaceae bacterium]|nr:TetR family transcriptional regulator [Dermatophilaceae bacterium]
MGVTDTGIQRPERLPRAQRMHHTREQIIRAALDLAAEDPGRRLTAERIAERAGVSRRTFFNYFPTVEAAFYAPVQQLLHAAVRHLEALPLDTPLLDSLTLAVTAAAADEPLDRLGLCAHLGRRMPQLQGSDLEHWDFADALLSEVFQKRYPRVDPFVVRCLTGAVVGACRAAVHEWDRRTDGDLAGQPDSLLYDLIATALAHVSAGFAAVDSA